MNRISRLKDEDACVFVKSFAIPVSTIYAMALRVQHLATFVSWGELIPRPTEKVILSRHPDMASYPAGVPVSRETIDRSGCEEKAAGRGIQAADPQWHWKRNRGSCFDWVANTSWLSPKIGSCDDGPVFHNNFANYLPCCRSVTSRESISSNTK
jgi:hypothetical protein